MKLFPHASLAALALATSACSVAAGPGIPVVPYAPPGVRVQPEVAQGFAAYETTLAAWGFWSGDRQYGVHWCPRHSQTGGRDASFQPYLNRGHWDVSDAPIGHAPAGSPVWTSEDLDTWGEITSHRGWWVQAPEPGASSRWCWVPGLEETPARVAWREGDGFVGWAPEPPQWAAADDDGEDDGLDWAYTLLGTLLEPDTDQNTLSGDARKMARSGTSPAKGAAGSRKKQQVGPSGTSVAAAREVLTGYVAKHPDAIAAGIEHTTVNASAPSGSSGSKTKSTKADKARDGAPLPSAMAYCDAFQMEPAYGPVGVAPGMRSGLAGSASTGSKAGSGAVASARTAGPAGESHARTAAAALVAQAPAAQTSGASASSGHASSSSGHGASSKGKGKSKSKSKR